MKKLKIKSILFAAFAMTLLSSAAWVAKTTVDRKAFRKEVKAYVKTEILPVAKAERQWLEGQLSAEEKAKIAELRGQLEAMKGSKGAKMRGRQKGILKEPLTDEELRERREQHKAHRIIMGQAWEIVGQHEADFDKVFEELLVKRTAWRAGIMGIAMKHFGDSLEHFRSHPKGEPGKGGKAGFNGKGGEKGGHPAQHGGSRGGKGGPFGMLQKAPFMMSGHQAEVRFLLWDHEAPLPFEKHAERSPKAGAMAFPNPVSNSFEISYELVTPGTVQVDILNRSGEVVKSLESFSETSGEHVVTVEVGDFSRGMYIYRLKTPDGTVTKRFLKE